MVPVRADAYLWTCGGVRAAVLSGNDDALLAVAAHSFGVADMVATMMCFVGHRRCGCLSSMEDRTEPFAEAFANGILACAANDPAVGQAFNAVFAVCR